MKVKIYNKNTIIRSFEKKDISKNFINSLNNIKINRFLHVGKKKQTFKSALQYFLSMNKKNYYYFAVFDKKKNFFIGTITFRPKTKKTCYIGFMISNINYLGSSLFFEAINNSISFMIYKKNYTKVLSAADKENLASSFTSLKIGFQLVKNKVSEQSFFFELKKKNFKQKTKFKIL